MVHSQVELLDRCAAVTLTERNTMGSALQSPSTGDCCPLT